MKIDAFCHILPRPYFDRFLKIDTTANSANLRKRVSNIPALYDIDTRFAQMDEFPGYKQIINIASPQPADLGSTSTSREMARVGNEALAELVRDHPDRFVGFMAALPMDDTEAAIAELDYAVNELGALGAQIHTNVHGHPMDETRFEPFYARAAELDRVIQVHPCRSAVWPDYPTESRSRYEIWWTFGWEYDLSAFMARIVFSGILERNPTLKLLIHHGGSMVPHFSERIATGWDQLGSRTPEDQQQDIAGPELSKRPVEYFRQMYVDTSLFGAAHALRCCLEFYGEDHVLFGTDSPYDPEGGPGYVRSTIKNIEEIGLSDDSQQQLFAGNAHRVFRLPDSPTG